MKANEFKYVLASEQFEYKDQETKEKKHAVLSVGHSSADITFGNQLARDLFQWGLRFGDDIEIIIKKVDNGGI